MSTEYLAELDAAIDNAGTLTTLRFSTRGYASARTDTPADASWLPYLADPGQLEQYLFSKDRTAGASAIAFGEVKLVNVNGDLDYLAAYDFSGQRLAIRAVEDGQTLATSSLVLKAQVDQVELDDGFVTVRLRDRQADLAAPIAAQLFAASATGGIPPLTRLRQSATISERPASSNLITVALSPKPAVGNHLAAIFFVKGQFRIGGSVSLPSVTDNQGGAWKQQLTLINDTTVMVSAVCRSVADPVPASSYQIQIELPAAGYSAEGVVLELSGALATAIWRARSPSGVLAPVPAVTSLITNGLPIAGDYAITLASVQGASGASGLQQPGGWVAELTQGALATSVACATASRQVTLDGAVDVTWYCNNSAGTAMAADLVVLACGTE